MPEPALIVIGGPTASGKTDAGIALARHFGTEVISADSRQFYHSMRIGTARPAEAELQGVRHHFLGHLELKETWSAGRFAREAEPVLQELLSTHGMSFGTSSVTSNDALHDGSSQHGSARRASVDSNCVVRHTSRRRDAALNSSESGDR